jgi:hypothetical protein
LIFPANLQNASRAANVPSVQQPRELNQPAKGPDRLMRLKLQPNIESSTILREHLQLSMGKMHEERMVGGELYKPRSRTSLSLDMM